MFYTAGPKVKLRGLRHLGTKAIFYFAQGDHTCDFYSVGLHCLLCIHSPHVAVECLKWGSIEELHF